MYEKITTPTTPNDTLVNNEMEKLLEKDPVDLLNNINEKDGLMATQDNMDFIAKHLNDFKKGNLNSSALRFIEVFPKYFIRNLKYINGLSKEVASKLIKLGSEGCIGAIIENPKSFAEEIKFNDDELLQFYKEQDEEFVAKEGHKHYIDYGISLDLLLERGIDNNKLFIIYFEKNIYAASRALYKKKFKGLSYDIALLLIRGKCIGCVEENLECFDELTQKNIKKKNKKICVNYVWS